jgi:hypothetical protein
MERFDPESYAIYLYAAGMVSRSGTAIGAPHWKWLGDGLGELRWRNGKTRFRLYGSEESGRRVLLAHPGIKDYRTFDNDDRDICLKRRSEFRSTDYDHQHRESLYLARKNARNRKGTDSGGEKCH